jgi:hypothetical protein
MGMIALFLGLATARSRVGDISAVFRENFHARELREVAGPLPGCRDRCP